MALWHVCHMCGMPKFNPWHVELKALSQVEADGKKDHRLRRSWRLLPVEVARRDPRWIDNSLIQ